MSAKPTTGSGGKQYRNCLHVYCLERTLRRNWALRILGVRHIQIARQRHIVFCRQNFGHHADRDLGRCLAADINSDRTAQSIQSVIPLVEVFAHALATCLVIRS